MKRSVAIVLITLLSLSALPLFGVSKRVAVSDFVVHSDNAAYKYMGKGISEMIAVELQKASGVDLVEREKRTELLKEMEMSLSDMADPAAQIEVGKLLAAGYIIYGEIVDMDKKVLISLRMAEVQTGQVVWAEKLTEKLSKYDYITGFFTKSILDYLNVEAVETTVAKVEAQEEKEEEAVVAFSKAIDLYDKKETDEAKKELRRAKRIDPQNEAVRVYVLKLETVSPKYRVELEKYVPAYNPASLSLIATDKVYMWSSSSVFSRWSADNIPDLGDGFNAYETTISWNLGYMFPVKEHLGLAVEYIGSNFTQKLETASPLPDDFFAPTAMNNGGCFSIGYGIGPKLSVGLSGFAYATGETWEEEEDDPTYYDFYVATDLGVLGMFLNGRLILDLQIIYTSQEQRYYDTGSVDIIGGQSYPLIIDNTVTAGFLNNRLFVTMKGIEELYFDSRGGYAVRAIPILEYFPADWLSFRAGYEYGHISQLGRSSSGHGGLAGVGGRIGRFELFLNYAYRNKILRIVPGYTLPEHNLLVGAVYSLHLVER